MPLWQVGIVAFVALCVGVRIGFWAGRMQGYATARRRFERRETVREA